MITKNELYVSCEFLYVNYKVSDSVLAHILPRLYFIYFIPDYNISKPIDVYDVYDIIRIPK